MEKTVCINCGEVIGEQDECYTLKDGSFVCEACYNDCYVECEMCGEVFHEDEMSFWGDCRICPDCLEEQCPSFDEEKNKAETATAYEEMKARYVGMRTKGLSAGGNSLDHTEETSETEITYYLKVTVDDKGVITDISRLTAEMLLSESITSSDWKPYPIDPYDYDSIADEMLEDYVVDEDEEDDE